MYATEPTTADYRYGGSAECPPQPDSLANLRSRLEGYVGQARSLASVAHRHADLVSGSRPVEAAGITKNDHSPFVELFDQLGDALRDIDAGLARL